MCVLPIESGVFPEALSDVKRSGLDVESLGVSCGGLESGLG